MYYQFIQVVIKTMSYISLHSFPRRQFKELRGSAERTVRELNDDRSCSMKKVAKHRPSQPKRSERGRISFLSRREKSGKGGRLAGLLTVKYKYKVSGVRKDILLREKKHNDRKGVEKP